MSNTILSDLKESTKTFIDDRLKNPYITTVIAVWLFTNRKVVFGIFNFQNETTLDTKIYWISTQLRSFNIGIFEGLFGGILYAFLVGIISMILFNLITGAGKTLYKWVNKISILMLKTVEPAKWISVIEFNKIYKNNEDLTKGNKELKKEIESIENELKLKNEQLLTLRNNLPQEPINKNEEQPVSKKERSEKILIKKIIERGYKNSFEKILSSIAKEKWIDNDETVDFLINLNIIEHIRTSNDGSGGLYRLSPSGMSVKDYYAINYME